MTDNKRRSPPPSYAEMFLRNPVLFVYVWVTNKASRLIADGKLPRLDDIIDNKRNNKRNVRRNKRRKGDD